ncbi:hypothetical protein CD039_09875 [Staphylococcus argensis]|uniref:Uncharacterized protein n=1 Tax=Staphylococcus argensis TaxID=1607738 RepID=A0A2K4FAT3_9STAP|nr:hypothetical protein CD039_09875 [Staphylococcus argensis]
MRRCVWRYLGKYEKEVWRSEDVRWKFFEKMRKDEYMKSIFYAVNVVNYVILVTLLVINYHNLSYSGLNIVTYFMTASLVLLVVSLGYYFYTRKDVGLVSMFINIVNLCLIAPMLLVFLF